MLDNQTFGIFDGARDETRINTHLHPSPLALTAAETFLKWGNIWGNKIE